MDNSRYRQLPAPTEPLMGGVARSRRTLLAMAIAGLAFWIFPSIVWGSVAGKVRQGNRQYQQENYDEALKSYREAQLEDPESALLRYNIGNALYKGENWSAALAEYGPALTSQDRQLTARSYYNMGNALFRLGKLPESVEAYKSALKIDPDDMDAKYNLELVQNLLQEQPQQQPQPSQEDQEKQEKQEQNQQQTDGEQRDQEEQQRQQRQQQQQQEQQGQQPEQQQQEQQPPPQPHQPGEMTEEEAARLLNALQEQEDKAQEERRQAQLQKRGRGELDW